MKRSIFVIGVPTFLLGLMLGVLLRHIPGLKYNGEVRAGEIAGFALTVFVVVIVNIIFASITGQKKDASDLVVSFARDVLSKADIYDAVISRYQAESPLASDSVHSIYAAESALSNAILLLETSLDDCKFDKGEVGFDKLMEARNQYRNVLDTPFPTYFPEAIKREQGMYDRILKESVCHLISRILLG